MRKLLLIFFITFASSNVNAECFGSENLQNCTDSYGNQYTVTRMGNYTIVDGYNPNTGSRWSSDSMTAGNVTYQNGRDAEGNTWNQTISRFGNTTMYDGTDSDGNRFSKSCTDNWDGTRSCY